MEKTVRIISQSPLATRKYLDKKTGTEKILNIVTLKLTDGIDTFLGEISGERAVSCPSFDPQHLYRVHCTLSVRSWNSQSGEQMQANTIHIDRIGVA